MSGTKVGTQTQGAPAAGAYTATLPTAGGYAAGDLLVHVLLCKYDDTSAHTINQGWTSRTPTGTGGLGAPGTDDGKLFGQVFTKEATSGSETAPTVTPGATAANTRIWYTFALRKTGASWTAFEIVWDQDIDTASPMGGALSFALTPTAGDAILGMWGTPTDTGTNVPTYTLSATGLTGGTVAGSPSGESTVGDDMSAAVAWWTGFTGTASSALTATVALAGNTNQTGLFGAILVRDGVLPTTLGGGLVTETDSALAATVGTGSRVTAGLVTETDTALALAGVALSFVLTAGLVSETDTALAASTTTLTPTTLTPGLVVETDTALAATVVAGSAITLGLVVETDSALAAALAISSQVAAGLVTESDTAFAAAVLIALTAGLALEADTALAVTVDSSDDTVLSAGLVSETDFALDVTFVISNLPHETEIGNRADGIDIDADADVDWDPGIAPRPLLAPAGQADLVVVVIDEFNRDEGFPRPVTREVRRPRERVRIRLAGADWSFRDDVPALCPDVQFQVPLLHGPGTWKVPQFDPRSDDRIGVGNFKRVQEQKPVALDLVDEDPASETHGQVIRKGFWKGFIQAIEGTDNQEGPGLGIELAGQAHGRAVMEWHPAPLIRRVRDGGVYLWNSLVGKLGQRMGHRIPHIGINLSNRGGMYEDQYLLDQTQLMVDRDTGAQWTVMPDDDGEYNPVVKDYETVHFTIYRDGRLNKGTWNTDLAERLNVIYADAIAPDGHRINFAVAPRLLRGSVPPYPFVDERDFGVGTTDEPGHPVDGDDDLVSTDDGNGVTALIWRLTHLGRLHRADLPGGYDQDVAQAVKEVRRAAEGLDEDEAVSGDVDVAFWNDLLWDNLVTGYSDEWVHIRPAVQRTKTEKFLRSGSGAIIGKNPKYDPHEIVRAAAFPMGQAPSTRAVVRAARGELAPINERDFVVEYVLDGGVLEGEHNPGDPVDATMIRNPILVQPGKNVWDPWLDGGRLVQVGHSQLSNDGKRVTLMASTRGYDGPKIWEIWDRARETRDNLARGRGKARASTMSQDNVAPWDRWSGQTDRDWDLVGGEWNEVVVPVGGAGTLNDIDVQLSRPAEFAMIVGPERLPRMRLNRKIQPLEQPPADPQRHHLVISGRPTSGTFTLDCDGDETSALAHDASAAAIQAAVRATGGAFAGATVAPIDGGFNVSMGGSEGNLNVGDNSLTGGHDPSISVTTAGPTTGDGAPWYGQPSNERWLKKEHGVLYAAGWIDQPCGYGSYVKNDGNGPTAQPLTGHHTDTAGVEYEADHNALYAYIWLGADNRLPRQQMFEQQISGV